MTTTLSRESRPSVNPSRHLQEEMAAVRLSFRWLGTQKSLTPSQKAEAAENFGAEGEYLSAAKKLLDTAHPAYRAVTSIRSKMTALWRASTIPFPETGVRLIPRQRIEQFVEVMEELRSELDDAVIELDCHYGEMRTAAASRLGRLYCDRDYPPSLMGWFQASWDFPSITPPDYLRQLSPALYEQECERVKARFAEAVEMTEQAFADEFAKLVSHLCDRISTEGTEKKVFRDSSIEKLHDFFDRFRQLNVRSNADLDRLVDQAQLVVRGVAPNDLRQSEHIRASVSSQLAQVQSSLDELLVDRPRRRILRNFQPTPESA